MNTIKDLMLATIAGLVLVGATAAHSARDDASGVSITANQAMDIALSKVPGTIHEVEFEHEDEIKAWEVELVSAKDGKEYEILIDATSGEVIEMELEDDEWDFFGFNRQDKN